MKTACLLLVLTVAPLLAADNFASATTLTGISASSTESNQTATEESGEPAYSNNSTHYRSLWWKWTAPSHGRATVDLNGSAQYPVTSGSSIFGKYLGVRVARNSSPNQGNLALVHAAGGQTFWNPSVQFPAVAGTTYYIHVTSEASDEYGNIRANVFLNTASDINDLPMQNPAGFGNAFADSRMLTGSAASSVAYTQSATVETGEPDIGYRTMWWTWVAPAHGRVTISTTGSDGSFWGKYINVLMGDTLGGLRVLTRFGGQAVYTPSLTLPVSAGQTYRIAISSHGDEGGSAVVSLNLATDTDINQLNIGAPASAANDLFGNRITLPAAANASAIGYGAYATVEALEPANAGYGTLWWTYIAPAAGTVSLSTVGSSTNYGKSLTVWTGGALPSLTQVARTAGSTNYTPAVSFTAAAGQTYQISVGAFTSGNTPGHVVLSLAGPPGALDQPVTGLVIDNAVRLRWPTVNGASYRLKSSNDLRTWTNLGDVILGDGSVKELYQPVIRTAQYFRIYPQ